MLRILVTSLLLCLVSPLMAAGIETGDPVLDAAFEQIQDRDFATKAEGVNTLAASGHPKAIELLRGLLEGRLRYLKKNKRLVWMDKQDGKYVAVDALNARKLRQDQQAQIQEAGNQQQDAGPDQRSVGRAGTLRSGPGGAAGVCQHHARTR